MPRIRALLIYTDPESLVRELNIQAFVNDPPRIVLHILLLIQKAPRMVDLQWGDARCDRDFQQLVSFKIQTWENWKWLSASVPETSAQLFKGVFSRLEITLKQPQAEPPGVKLLSQIRSTPRPSGSVVLCLNSATILRALTSVFRVSISSTIIRNLQQFNWYKCKEHYKTITFNSSRFTAVQRKYWVATDGSGDHPTGHTGAT
ncbi:uncharacterized protein BJ212DRAFT_1297052 [Suillus subaureus]|uniref:Uncharacterized protein n=1 Tax=Suillus subaureus TaxID=48587 RepID=A0A9P7EGZ3_9AGAM|nr:uncharacterized protein BJ212DRAFT_1297052 [Suillus subaureus]KAG1821718.1 hypothetical protein BJ212DRAFT_1297052 [Suillus subaureus]